MFKSVGGMWAMVFLYLFFSLLIAVILIVEAIPFVIGIIIICLTNIISRRVRQRYASIEFNILTVIMTFASSIVFNVDIFNDNMNLGFMPFVMLLIYGVVSVVYVCVSGKISKMYSTGHEDTEVRENTCPFKDL